MTEKDGIPDGLTDAPPYVVQLECIRCKKLGRPHLKPASEFHPRYDRARGYQYECKQCRKELKEEAKISPPPPRQFKKDKHTDPTQKEKETREGKKAKEKENSKRATKAKQAGKASRTKKAPQKRTFRNRTFEDVMLDLAEAKLVGSDPKELNFWLNAILDLQLRLFYEPGFVTPTGRAHSKRLIETALFVISRELTRLSAGIQRVRQDEVFRTGPRCNLILAERTQACLLLEVPFDAPRAQVCKAYKQKARIHHPDFGGSDEEMQKINAAYTVLMEKFRASRKDRHDGVAPPSQEDE